MLDTDIYVKTDAGREEIRARSRGLPMSVRAILLMVDGQRDVAAMRTLIAGSKAPADVLDGLEAQGLIERASPDRPTASTSAPLAPAAPVPGPAAPRDAAAGAPTTASVPTATAAASAVSPVPASAAAFAAPPKHPVASPDRHAAPEPSRQGSSAASYEEPLDLRLPTIPVPEPEVASPAPVAAPLAPPISRYEHLYGMMNDIVRDFLSPTRRYFFQLKIERAATPDELLELLHDLQTALSKSRGDAFASEVIARLRNAAA